MSVHHQLSPSSPRRFRPSPKRNSWGLLTKKSWSNLRTKNSAPPTPPADQTEFDLDTCIPVPTPAKDVSIQVKPRNSLTLSEALTARVSKNFGQWDPPTPVSPNEELFVDEDSDSDSESRIGYVVCETPCDIDSPNSSVIADELESEGYHPPTETAREPIRSRRVRHEPHVDDLDDGQAGSGLFAGLISELGDGPNMTEPSPKFVMTPQPKAGSMHRQLAPKARDEVAITFFSDTVPKQTSAHISTLSANVFPIKEESVTAG